MKSALANYQPVQLQDAARIPSCCDRNQPTDAGGSTTPTTIKLKA